MKELPATWIESLEDVTVALAQSESKVAIIYKHSPVCGRSEMALREMKIFSGELPENALLFYVDVIGSKPASQKFEEVTGIRHESPQVLFIQNRVCIWNTSHGAIKAEALRNAYGKIIGPNA